MDWTDAMYKQEMGRLYLRKLQCLQQDVRDLLSASSSPECFFFFFWLQHQSQQQQQTEETDKDGWLHHGVETGGEEVIRQTGLHHGQLKPSSPLVRKRSSFNRLRQHRCRSDRYRILCSTIRLWERGNRLGTYWIDNGLYFLLLTIDCNCCLYSFYSMF